MEIFDFIKEGVVGKLLPYVIRHGHQFLDQKQIYFLFNFI